MEYHRTKDILYVMRLLGHKNIAGTLTYTQLVEFKSDEYCSAVASNVDEAKKLIKSGFEYVCSHNETMLFKRENERVLCHSCPPFQDSSRSQYSRTPMCIVIFHSFPTFE